MIYDTVIEQKDHPTADAVYARLKPLHPSLSLATVYRNLNQLAEAGSLRRVDSISECARFDGTLEPHGHFVCTRCGRIEDVLPDCEGEICRALGAERGKLHVSSVEVVIRGLCSSCARQEEAAH